MADKQNTNTHGDKSIKAVALYELVKGSVAILVALLVMVWHDKLPTLAVYVSHQLPIIFGELVSSQLAVQLDNLNHYADIANQNWFLGFWLIIAYALVRFVECYGLYYDKLWAYWLSVLGYGIFLPIEMYYLIAYPFDWVRLGVFLFNLMIVVVVYRHMKQKRLI